VIHSTSNGTRGSDCLVHTDSHTDGGLASRPAGTVVGSLSHVLYICIAFF